MMNLDRQLRGLFKKYDGPDGIEMLFKIKTGSRV